MKPTAKRLAWHRRHLLVRLLGSDRCRELSITQTLFLFMSLIVLTHAQASNRVPNLHEFALADINPQPATQVTFHTIAKGYRSSLHSMMEVVARNQSEWNLLWRNHSSVNAISLPPPVIDFDKEIVVGIFLGDKPTGGYDVAIIRAEQSNGDLVISFREKSPSKGAMVTQSLTQPFHMVRVIGGINSKVTFRRES